VNLKSLRESWRNWGDAGEFAARSRVLLTLDEVRTIGVPAFFFDYDEQLLYLDDELYDMTDAGATWQADARPRPLPRHILDDGVGIEFGWRHASECACKLCRKRDLPEIVREAVA
jgi:hypothetical protein